MKKTATSLALLLFLGAAPARAADCLQQIDNIAVEYDLPASESMAGTKYDLINPAPPPDQPPTAPPPSGFTQTPAGRPGMHGGGAPAGGPLGGNLGGATADFPKMPPRHNLGEQQRRNVMAKLQEARAVEATGNETQCFERLKEAQALLGKTGS